MENKTKIMNMIRAHFEDFGFRKFFASLILVLEIILAFTFVDYLVHSWIPEFEVPSNYFINKIIYGTIIGFITYLFIWKKPALQKSLILSTIVVILLQLRYLLTGYDLSFVLLFLGIHFVILLIVSWAGFKLTKL